MFQSRVTACDSRAQGFSPPLARQRSSCPPPSPNLVRTHPIVEYYQALRDSAPCLSRAATLPKGTKLGLGKRRAPGNTIILSQPYRRRVSTDRLNREGSQLAASLEGEPGPTPAGKTLPHSFPETSRFRARFLRNLLVSGNECGRVFPAGVGPGSPSRDAANWLPSRFSLSVETRRRYGWLRMMVFPGARLFPSPNLVPFGRVAARERQGALSRRAW